ncbi:hypothetical protein [Pseudomonas asiatica]|uniref:hypothetical protein n=1 Tax=Pseudomonas asiatica TaxID=2219225 RepID=UPI0010BFC42A|nr:hypothetical protein [Pseudomonas asiatica]
MEDIWPRGGQAKSSAVIDAKSEQPYICTPIELDPSKALPINVAATFSSDAESILAVFQVATSVKLSDAQVQDAKTTGLEVAATGEPSVRSLVDRWAEVSGLESFAAAVKSAMIPD